MDSESLLVRNTFPNAHNDVNLILSLAFSSFSLTTYSNEASSEPFDPIYNELGQFKLHSYIFLSFSPPEMWTVFFPLCYIARKWFKKGRGEGLLLNRILFALPMLCHKGHSTVLII